jgi:hypothetical protein
VNVHAKSRLILEPLRTLRSEDKGQAGACPNRTRASVHQGAPVESQNLPVRNSQALCLWS